MCSSQPSLLLHNLCWLQCIVLCEHSTPAQLLLHKLHNVCVDTLCTALLQPQVQYLSDAEVDIDPDEEDDMEDYVRESGSGSEDEDRQNGAAEQAEPLRGSGSQRRAAAPGRMAPAKRRAGACCDWVCERHCKADQQMGT